MKDLIQARKEERAYTEVRDAIQRMYRFWDHPLHVRAFGAYVSDTAAVLGLLPKVERTFSIQFHGEDEALVYGAHRST